MVGARALLFLQGPEKGQEVLPVLLGHIAPGALVEPAVQLVVAGAAGVQIHPRPSLTLVVRVVGKGMAVDAEVLVHHVAAGQFLLMLRRFGLRNRWRYRL